MKTFHGFSPLSVAALFVAALVFPVLLFPFGGALLMNIVYIYGHREYEHSKSTLIFRSSIIGFAFASAIYALLFMMFSFQDLFSAVRALSIFGSLMRESIPNGFEAKLFIINFYGFLMSTNPAIVYHFQFFAKYPKDNNGYQLSGYYSRIPYAILPVAVFILASFQLIYLSGASHESGENFRNSLIDIKTFEAILLLITVFVSYYSAMRIYYKGQLSRKY